MLCGCVEGTVYYLGPLLAIRTFEEHAIFRKFPTWHRPMIRSRNCRSLALLWTKEIPCSCLKAMWLQGPWSDGWLLMGAFLNVTHTYLYLFPPSAGRVRSHLKRTRLLDLFPALSSSTPWFQPWCHAEGEPFSHPCLCGLVSHTARWQAGIAGSFWPLPSDALHMTSGVGAEDRSVSAWFLEIPQLFPILHWEGENLFLFVCWRSFQLGFQMTLFQRGCLLGLILWMIEP